MTFNSKITIDGTERSDFINAKIKKRVSTTNASSTFTITYDNFDGFYSSTFSISNEVIIYADDDATPTTKLLTGEIVDIQYTGKPNYEQVVVKGIGYVENRFKNFQVEPEVYNNTEVSVIIKDLIDKYSDGTITYTNVAVTTTTLTRITFKNISLWDAIKQLAELSNTFFYGDTNKDVHLQTKESVSSGLTFNNTNVINSKFKTRENEMVNQIWVYGDNVLTGWQNSFTSAGSVSTGSVYTLDYKPHNTEVTVSGITYNGAVYQMTTLPVSGQQYLVNYDDQQIIFTSGAGVGDNVPASGVSVLIKYDRRSPIIKFGRELSSITTYGKKGKVIVDKSINDPRTATDIVQSQLGLYSSPQKEGTLKLDQILNVTPGQTCVVDLPYQNVSSQTFTILEASYNFTAKDMIKENALTIRVNEKTKDVVDTLKQMILDIKKLQVADVDTSDVITRLETGAGSVGIRVNGWYLKSWEIGSNMIWNHPTPANGTWGGATWTGSGTKTYTIVKSGGFI